VDTAAGDITVQIPAQTAFGIDARTHAGRITSDHPVISTVQGTLRGRQLQGSVSGGGPVVTLSTVAGDIVVH
jgi:hypothetical protein